MAPSRRNFLSVIVASSAATCLAPLGCAARLSGTYAMGNVADLAPGGTLTIADTALAVFRDADGLWSTTTICTHLQCDMLLNGTVTADEQTCDCHGSVFTGDGDVVEGPANQPLENFAVSVDSDGAITVDADTVVDAGTRTLVVQAR